jgi:hypothetical protein
VLENEQISTWSLIGTSGIITRWFTETDNQVERECTETKQYLTLRRMWWLKFVNTLCILMYRRASKYADTSCRFFFIKNLKLLTKYDLLICDKKITYHKKIIVNIYTAKCVVRILRNRVKVWLHEDHSSRLQI